MSEDNSNHFRCTHCGKLLAKDNIEEGHFEIKCLRCGALNVLFRDTKEQIVVTDPNGVILFANGLTEVVTGYSLEEIIGKTPALWGGLMPKEFYDNMWHQIRDEKKSISVELTNHRKICGHTITEPEDILVVEDTLKDDRFASNPYVLGEPFVRFYAGVRIFDRKTKMPVGVFCVKDRKPRTLSIDELAVVLDCAARAEEEINK